jgi:hypothetical protein
VIRRLVIVVGALLGVSMPWSLTSCNSAPTSCIARGAMTSSTGTASYTLTTPDDAEVSWSVAASIDVYDITPGCWYSDMEFELTVGTCSLWLQAPGDAAGPEDGGDSGAVTGEVEPGATCQLPIAGGNATVNSLTGTLTMGPSLSLALSGDVAAIKDAAVTSPERISWRFDGVGDYEDD